MAQVTTPNVSTESGSTSVALFGTTFVNQGLVGTGRVSASAKDFLGDTLGSFSGMAIDLSTWRKSASGQYSGVFYTLPDRGYNSAPFFSDYAGRLHRYNVLFNPYTGTTNLPAATSSQSQVQMTADGGIVLKDDAGNNFTGFDPGSGSTTRLGARVPMPTSGTGAGRISLDAEGLAFHPNGTFYISDEYAANIYHFSRDGKLLGIINPPVALRPVTGGNPDFNSINPPSQGRRNNQGLEGISISPDGKKLITVLQSATVQDSNEVAGQQFRSNTRVIVYDISTSATPTTPSEHYVLSLPTLFRGNTSGADVAGAVNRTAAQSEVLALNDKQLLVLSRDGNGRGNDATNVPGGGSDRRPITYKSILLVDLSGATNLAGTVYETSATPVAPSGLLLPSVRPVERVELVNMINTTQLGRFGLNTSTRPANALSMTEKFEAMGLAPTLEKANPQDFFLFVGNDNDFLTTNGTMQGSSYNGGVESDSQMYVYRLTLPTYVDPMYLQSMLRGAPIVASSLAQSAFEMSQSADRSIGHQLNSIRRGGGQAWSANTGVWISGNASFSKDHTEVSSFLFSDTANLDGTLIAGTVGADAVVAPGVRVGGAITVAGRKQDTGAGFSQRTEGYAFSAYAGYFGRSFYLLGSVNHAPQINLDDIRRPAAYGLTAHGETSGTSTTFAFEAGAPVGGIAGITFTPFVGARFSRAHIDGFTETEAIGGNVNYDAKSYERTVLSAGVEAATKWMNMTPSLRIAYSRAIGDHNEILRVSLASAQSALAVQNVAVPLGFEHSVNVAAGLQGSFAPNVGWSLNYDARINADKTSDVSQSVIGSIRIGF